VLDALLETVLDALLETVLDALLETVLAGNSHKLHGSIALSGPYTNYHIVHSLSHANTSQDHVYHKSHRNPAGRRARRNRT